MYIPLIRELVSRLGKCALQTNKAALSSCGTLITALLLPAGQGSGSRPPLHYQGRRREGKVRQQEVSARDHM